MANDLINILYNARKTLINGLTYKTILPREVSISVGLKESGIDLNGDLILISDDLVVSINGSKFEQSVLINILNHSLTNMCLYMRLKTHLITFNIFMYEYFNTDKTAVINKITDHIKLIKEEPCNNLCMYTPGYLSHIIGRGFKWFNGN